MVTTAVMNAILYALIGTLFGSLLVAIRAARVLSVLRKAIVRDSTALGPVRWMALLLGKESTSARDMLREIEALQQAELGYRTRFKTLTDNIAAAVIMHRSDGTIVWCSPYTEVLTGFSISEVLKDGHNFMRAHAYEEDRHVIENSLAIVMTGEPFQCRYRFYHKSGVVLWLDTRTVPVFDAPANEYIALSITLDVTASVMSELKTEERNRDLNEFTYMISHDLKSPIVTLRGMLGILKDEMGDSASQEAGEALDYMGKAIYRLEQLVEGVLELARVSSVDKILEPVDTQGIVSEVLGDFRLDLERHRAHVTMIEELPWVLGDRIQLYQIFSNLIGNALKYREADRPLMISVTARGGASRHRVCIDIRDNGRGIAQEYTDMIFKPFNRGGERHALGSGVGLACVKRLVEKFGGSVSVRSVVGEGSVFTIELRRAVTTQQMQ